LTITTAQVTTENNTSRARAPCTIRSEILSDNIEPQLVVAGCGEAATKTLGSWNEQLTIGTRDEEPTQGSGEAGAS
jgi:hypothetical protein